jgi:predicted dehydrogenase
MEKKVNRRKFVGTAIAGTAGLGLYTHTHAFNILKTWPVPDKLHIAVIGVNSRGLDHVRAFTANPSIEVTYICDVDRNAVTKAMDLSASAGQDHKPKVLNDFREALDDKALDAVSIAMPDHWHTPAALYALKAGKHVYLEKPGSHNPAEAELLVKAQQKYAKVIQMGNQRRSWPRVIEAIKDLHSGIIGKVYYARTWYTNNRPSIGKGKIASVPAHLDYELWQGPARRQPFKDNLIHYHWHWRWHWGTGEVVNNGTHFIDLARWGLQVNFPSKVFSTGGRYQYDDDWETPDTQVATFDFAEGKTITWEGRSCNQRSINDMGSGVSFHGESGTLELRDNSYRVFNNKGEVVKSAETTSNANVTLSGPGFDLDKDHVENFVQSVLTGSKQNSPYNECYKSVLLCHLANISYRVGRSLKCDPLNGHIREDPRAMKLWSREYEKGWIPQL